MDKETVNACIEKMGLMRYIGFRAYLLKKMLKLNVYKMMHRDGISEEERQAMIIVRKYVKNPNSTVLMRLSNNNMYIDYKNGEVFIMYMPSSAEIIIANHKYRYNVKLNDRSAEAIYNEFDREMDSRRDDMEYRYLKNTITSLRKIANGSSCCD